jgi:hypothetical protein
VGVAGDDAVLAVHQHGVGEAGLSDTRGDLRDLGIAVGAGVAGFCWCGLAWKRSGSAAHAFPMNS